MMYIGGKRIHYSRKGFGKPILFIHGWGGTLNSLKEVSSFFEPSSDVILLDLPGFGESELPDPGWGSYDYAHLVVLFLKQLGINNIVYFGHSFGGSLGIIISALHPFLISKLILCNSAYKRTDKKSNTASSFKRFFYSIPVLNSFGPFIRKIGYHLFFRNSDLCKFPKLESNFKKIMTEDLTPLLKKIKTKTLILWGEEDRQTPVPLAHELKEKIINSKLHIFPNQKHNLPLSNPLLITHVIKEFIES